MDSHQVSPDIFDWIQFSALAGLLRDRVILKLLLHHLDCVFRIIVLLEGEPLAESEVLSTLDQVFMKDHLSTLPHSTFPQP